jgi:alkanesulfonate monooxygenase SsuD/methylene tetrahydromethanopterin reductase-like flavin-dependent oxidoreductase (luciferase family)
MDYGILTEPQIGGSYESQVRLARWCEDNGVTVFGRSDHYLFGNKSFHATDAFAALAGLARETTTAELCAMVSPITFRHPGVIAKMAATIDEMSGGRFILGLGTGWMQEEHDAFGLELWPMQERFARFEEALQYVRAATSPGARGFDGEFYSLAEVDVLPVPGRLRIMVGGGGPRKTPTLAGRYADEYNQFGDAPDELVPRLEVFRQAATDADRDPDDIVVSVVLQAVVGRDDAEYRDRLGAAAAKRNLDPTDYEIRLTGRGMLVGTPDRAQATMAALADIGVTRTYLQFVDDLDTLDTAEMTEVVDIVRG